MAIVMTKRLEELFAKKGGIKFMPFVCCGDPSEEFTVKLAKKLVESGADALEFGIPFSDPFADGKTMQAAASRALAFGMTAKKAIGVIARLRKEGVEVPIVPMAYFNLLYAYEGGVAGFVCALKEAGADGVIVPDASLEESGELADECRKNDIACVLLVAPNTSDERLKEFGKRASGFLYAVAVFGTTGARESVDARAIELVKRAKKAAKLPVVAGFGISKQEHARKFEKAGADGFIIASEIANIYSKFIGKDGRIDEEKAIGAVGKFSREFKFHEGKVE